MTPAQRITDRKLAALITVRLRLDADAEVNVARAIHRHGSTGWLLILGPVVIWSEAPPTTYGALKVRAAIVELATIAADLEQ